MITLQQTWLIRQVHLSFYLSRTTLRRKVVCGGKVYQDKLLPHKGKVKVKVTLQQATKDLEGE
jgi:hypothetical protein